MSDEEIEAYYLRWEQSDEGYARKLAGLVHSLVIQPDGSFSAPRIPPGEYHLGVYVSEVDPGSGVADMTASASATVTVPPAAPSGDAGPLDAGTIALKPSRYIKVGAPAPPIAGRTADGVEVGASDYAGAYLLVHFRAPWQPDSADVLAALAWVTERFPPINPARLNASSPTPGPTATWASLARETVPDSPATTAAGQRPTSRPMVPSRSDGGSPRLGFLTVNFAGAPPGEAAGSRASRVAWPEVFGFVRPVEDGGSIRPDEAMLIGPDGRVLAKHLRGQKLVDAVVKVLGHGEPRGGK
jgi:hypothetical protein